MSTGDTDGILELSLINDLREIGAAAEKVDAFCEAQGIAAPVAYAVNLSIDEILTNTISYGYDDDAEHRIDLTFRVEGESLVVTIVDDGRPFDSSTERAPDFDATIEERALGGLGLFLVQQMMDEMTYERSDDRNVITLRKSTVEQPEQ